MSKMYNRESSWFSVKGKLITSGGNYDLVKEDLEKLAELGQINAMQEWYRHNGVGVNKMIDSIAEAVPNRSFEEVYLKALKAYASDKDKINAGARKVDELLGYVNVAHAGLIHSHSSLTHSILNIPNYVKKSREYHEALSEMRNGSEYFSLMEQAITSAQAIVEEDSVYSAFAYSRLREMLNEYMPYAYDKEKEYRDASKFNRKFAKDLMGQVESSDGEDMYDKVLDNPKYAYACASVLLDGNTADKTIGRAIINELSVQEVSSAVMAHELER